MKMARWIFFFLHFVLGFLLLWLILQLTQYGLFPRHGAQLWAEAAVQTIYLVAGVIWGNVGWDAFKQIPNGAQFSLMVYTLSRTVAPIAIGIPLPLIALSPFFQGQYISWRLMFTWQNAVLLCVAIVVFLLQKAYRRSEKGFFYKSWGTKASST